MTTKTKKVHENLDGQGQVYLNNFGLQVLSSDPATTYARIYQRSTDGAVRSYNLFTSAWETIGTVVIPADYVTNAMLADMPANTVKANITGSLDNPTNATLAAFKTWLTLVKADVGLGSVTNDAQLKAADLDIDGTLAANSDAKIASQKATKTYIDGIVAAADAMVFKGVIDCSANPNYPAADRGWTYKVSVAGKIGGASGVNVEVGDTMYCLTDGTASGNQATVGSAWQIVQANLDGAVVGPASSVDGDIALFNGTGGKTIKTLTGSNDDFAQRKAGAWVNRTVAQVKTDLGVTGMVGGKYAADIGDGVTADIVVTHNLGTRDVQVTVRTAASPYDCQDVYWEATSTTTITIFFPAPPTSAELRVIVIG